MPRTFGKPAVQVTPLKETLGFNEKGISQVACQEFCVNQEVLNMCWYYYFRLRPQRDVSSKRIFLQLGEGHWKIQKQGKVLQRYGYSNSLLLPCEWLLEGKVQDSYSRDKPWGVAVSMTCCLHLTGRLSHCELRWILTLHWTCFKLVFEILSTTSLGHWFSDLSVENSQLP